MLLVIIVVVTVDGKALFASLARRLSTILALFLLSGLGIGRCSRRDGVQQERRGGARVEQGRLDCFTCKAAIKECVRDNLKVNNVLPEKKCRKKPKRCLKQTKDKVDYRVEELLEGLVLRHQLLLDLHVLGDGRLDERPAQVLLHVKRIRPGGGVQGRVQSERREACEKIRI